MSNYDTSSVTTTESTTKTFTITPDTTDGPTDQKETYWDIENPAENLGYYYSIPELKKAIDSYATWVIGKGWTANTEVTATLDNITGWGEDTFNSIMWNMLVCKKIYGDAFAEIIRSEEDNRILNIKVLDPARMRIVVDEGGILNRYEYRKTANSKEYKDIAKEKVLHLCNDRIADNIHGTTVIKACQWVIDARNEAMEDWRNISHLSSLRVLYSETTDPTTIANLKSEYRNATDLQKKTRILIIPGKPEDYPFVDLVTPNVDNYISWIRYLENFFYQAVGIPKVILGGSEEFTEASSKIGYLTFEQIYKREVVELQQDLLNQLKIRIEFNLPASINNELLSSESKNTGQTSIQPKETTATLQRE